MATFNLAELSNELKDFSRNSAGSGVSFAKRALKLDSEKDVLPITEAIQSCPLLEYLDLEGNTLGPDAARAIAEVLKKKGSDLKRALWKDMFTGRSKAEIPKALKCLGTALCTAGTHLVELDLSDNAFGPIGVQGLATFLASPSCYTLQELRLNNNGLGISGGLMLAKALSDCYDYSAKTGEARLALKVFIAGRNRLENEGAKALASVFEKLGTLEEVAMPQNGIYHPGIAALANGLSHNPGLRILNLNDNTVGWKGASALAKALPNFQRLEQLNLGDCLLKTKGCIILSRALSDSLHLTDLNLSYNEIYYRGAEVIAILLSSKSRLKTLQLDGNFFGSRGCKFLHEAFKSRIAAEDLNFNEDQSGEESEENENESESEEENQDEQLKEENTQEESRDEEEESEESEESEEDEEDVEIAVSTSEFLMAPTPDKLLMLHTDVEQDFIKHARCVSKKSDTSTKLKFAEEFTRIVVVVSSYCDNDRCDIRLKAIKLSDILYSRLCVFAAKKKETSFWSNALLVHLGLIKSEDNHYMKINWSLEGSFKALERICQQEYFLPQLKDTLRLILDNPVKINRSKVIDPFQQSKDSLRRALDYKCIVTII